MGNFRWRYLGLGLVAWCLVACSGDNERQAAVDGVLEGSVFYRERIALPPGAELEVQLEDVSRPDAPAAVLATVVNPLDGTPPFAFRIDYQPSQIDPDRLYGLRASIRQGQRLLFTSDSFVDAFATAPVEIQLRQVPGAGG